MSDTQPVQGPLVRITKGSNKVVNILPDSRNREHLASDLADDRCHLTLAGIVVIMANDRDRISARHAQQPLDCYQVHSR